MDELRERIARAIIGAAGTNGPGEGALMSARRQADRVLKELGLVQFWSVAYGDGEGQAEETYEHWDSARDLATDATQAGYPDAHVVTAWFTGWQDDKTPMAWLT